MIHEFRTGNYTATIKHDRIDNCYVVRIFNYYTNELISSCQILDTFEVAKSRAFKELLICVNKELMSELQVQSILNSVK